MTDIFDRMSRNLIILAIVAIAVILLLANSIKVVSETQQGVILRVGEPVAIINPYKPKQQFGEAGAGLIAVIPGFDSIIWIDKRVKDVDMPSQQVLSTDQYRLNVDAFARYRIVNPLRMYTAARTEDRLSSQLASILGSVVRSELGKRQYRELLSPERGIIMDNIRKALDVQATQYGRRDRRCADQEDRSARRRGAGRGLCPHAECAYSGSAHDRSAGCKAGSDHPRRCRCPRRRHLCRGIRKRRAIL